MSPQTAHSWDGENVAELCVELAEDLVELVVEGSIFIMRLCTVSLLLLLLLRDVLLLVVMLRQLGELEAELGVLGMVLYNRLNLGLSLLEVDSERWAGIEICGKLRPVWSDIWGNVDSG